MIDEGQHEYAHLFHRWRHEDADAWERLGEQVRQSGRWWETAWQRAAAEAQAQRDEEARRTHWWEQHA